MVTVGLVHPGRMGAAVGREPAGAGTRVVWCAAGRSEATVRRAGEAGLDPVPDLAALAAACDLVISLCPPAAAVFERWAPDRDDFEISLADTLAHLRRD